MAATLKLLRPAVSTGHVWRVSTILPATAAVLTSVRGMAGHSKWANIRHTKAAKDAERVKIYNKCGRLIRVAIKDGGGSDPKTNTHLAKAIEYAKSNSMPVSSIDSVIKSAQKSQDDAKPATVEYRGPGGTFMVLDLLTSNMARTRIELASALRKLHVEEVRGSARHLFEEKGVIVVAGEGHTLEDAMDAAIECGAEDVTQQDADLVFSCAPEDFLDVKRQLEEHKYSITYANVDKVATNPVTLGPRDQEAVEAIIQRMEDLDDVMKVHINL